MMYNIISWVRDERINVTANNNDVNFVFKGWRYKLNKDHLISQLAGTCEAVQGCREGF